MKKNIVIVLFLSTFSTIAQPDFYAQANAFFGEHVDDEGQVAYKDIKADPTSLQTLLSTIADTNFEELTATECKAFLINTYNILVIKQVVELMPLKSPLDNPLFFKGINHKVGNASLTLDQLEKGTLMKEFNDARLHFVLVCAAKSCPPLANFAYTPDDLEEQLEQRTKFVLNLDWFISVDKKVALSQIFNWYRADFEKKGQSLIDYVNIYRTSKLDATKSPKFYEYDWALNIQ